MALPQTVKIDEISDLVIGNRLLKDYPNLRVTVEYRNYEITVPHNYYPAIPVEKKVDALFDSNVKVVSGKEVGSYIQSLPFVHLTEESSFGVKRPWFGADLVLEHSYTRGVIDKAKYVVKIKRIK